MDIVTQDEAISRLPQLIDCGREFLVSRAGTPVAKVTPLGSGAKQKPGRKAGGAAGKLLYMADDFDAPLDDFRDYI